MNPAVVWLASKRSDGKTGGRYIGRLWNDRLPPDEAAAGALTQPAFRAGDYMSMRAPMTRRCKHETQPCAVARLSADAARAHRADHSFQQPADRAAASALCAARARHSRHPSADDRQMEPAVVGARPRTFSARPARWPMRNATSSCSTAPAMRWRRGRRATRGRGADQERDRHRGDVDGRRHPGGHCGALNLKRLILLTPYDQGTNDHEIDYLRQIGVDGGA